MFNIDDWRRESLGLLIELCEEHAKRANNDPGICTRDYLSKVFAQALPFMPEGFQETTEFIERWSGHPLLKWLSSGDTASRTLQYASGYGVIYLGLAAMLEEYAT